jgi:acyl-coenzyme A synthetase/AMP-(fatty) acid ligase
MPGSTYGARRSATVPLVARLRLLGDRGLGVGNFLDRVHAISPATDVPFLAAQRLAARGQTEVEWFSLDDLVDVRTRYAAWYHGAEVRKGEPVAVYLDEGVDSFLHFLALSALGAVPALINGRMDSAVAADYIRRIGATGVVTAGSRAASMRSSGALPEELAFLVDHAEPAESAIEQHTLPSVFPYPHGDEDPVMLCHTSGTTGPPKAAIFGHRQFFLGKRSRLWNFPPAARNRMLSALPQSHSAGISYLMTATLLGMPTLVMADTGADAVRAAMREFRPTIVAAFSQTYAELAQLGLDGAADTVHSWFNTGDSAHEAHIRALVRHGRRPGRFGSRPGSRFIDGLGSSEMGMALFRKISVMDSADYDRCVGTPIKVVKRATVLDDDGRELGPDQVGRLAVRTPTRTPGYWNNSELTNKSSFAGYWLTGDVVYRDGKGRFFHLDRVPDVIHTDTGPVYSLPMEEAIMVGCPWVADCAVVAVTAPTSGHVPFATVKLKPGVEVPADLLGTLNAALTAKGLSTLSGAALAQQPGDFPTGPTGKVLKRHLRERFANALTTTTA